MATRTGRISAQALLNGVLKGDRSSLARAITLGKCNTRIRDVLLFLFRTLACRVSIYIVAYD